MARTGRSATTDLSPITLGEFTLTATGVEIHGHPSYDNYVGALAFAQGAHKASGWWLADLLRYGDTRADWGPRLSQAQHSTGLSEKTLMNVRAIGAIDESRRRENVEFSLHGEVVGLTADEQVYWLAKAETEGWTKRELRLEIRTARRAKIIDGQAILEGLFRVVYADCPWEYGDRPPSGSGAQQHYRGMSIADLCALPVKAHTLPNSVLFFWVPVPLTYQNPGPREVIEAWGYTQKTGMVWDKVQHGFGHYVEVRHENLFICTRGSCLPDRPTPQIPSVLTERRSNVHSEKPETMRQNIERLYDGPYLELFGRQRVDGWTVFGDDARLWSAPADDGAALPVSAAP